MEKNLQGENSQLRILLAERLKSLISAVYGAERGAISRFSAAIGASQGNVSDWLNGTKAPSFEAFHRIGEETRINLDWLIRGVGQMSEAAPPPAGGFPENYVIRGTVIAFRAAGNGRVTPEDFGILVSTAGEYLSQGMSEEEALEEINPAARAYIRSAAVRPPQPDLPPGLAGT